MVKLYTDKKRKVGLLQGLKDLCIESTLSTGDRQISFSYLKSGPFADALQLEAYLETKDDYFVVKERVDPDTSGRVTITATLDIEGLENTQFPTGFETVEKNPAECLALAFAGSGWKLGACEITKRRTVRIESSCSAWDVAQRCATVYKGEIVVHSKECTIDLLVRVGEDKGSYFKESLNLKKLDAEANTYNFATRLYLVGKDGLQVGEHGLPYVENFQYTDKLVCRTWKDERYTVAENLLEDGIAKLDEMSRPYISYAAEVIDLASQSEVYREILDFGLGDTLTLLSKTRRVRERHRIVKLFTYPYTPEKNQCELANARLSFADVQKQEEEIQQAEMYAVAAAAADEKLAEFGGSDAMEQVKKALESVVTENVEETFARTYATKQEMNTTQGNAEDYADKAITKALVSYLDEEATGEAIHEALVSQQAENVKLFAAKAGLEGVETEVGQLHRSLEWLIDQLGLGDEYDDFLTRPDPDSEPDDETKEPQGGT